MTVLNVPNFSEKSNDNLDLPLIERDGLKLVDSRTIAEALGLEHESLMKNVNSNVESIEKGFGHLRFEIGDGKALPQGGRCPGEKFALLTEDQALFVGTLSRNTEKVVEFKTRLIQTFQRIRHAGSYITQASNEDLLSRVDQLEKSVFRIAKETMALAITSLANRFPPIETTPKKPSQLASSRKASDKNDDGLLSTEEVADILKLSVNTLRNWRCLGRGPKWITLGKMVRYEKSDVYNYLKKCREETSDDIIDRSNHFYVLENTMGNRNQKLVDVSDWRIRAGTIERVQAFRNFFGCNENMVLCEDDVIDRGLKLLYESITK